MGLECPICKNKSFIVQITYPLKIDNKWGKFDSLIDATVLTGNKTGVCTNCGIVAFGELIYKSNNNEEALNYFDKLMAVTTKYHFVFQRIIESVPPDQRKTEADKAFYEVLNNLKLTDSVFFANTKPDKFIIQSFKFAKENRK